MGPRRAWGGLTRAVGLNRYNSGVTSFVTTSSASLYQTFCAFYAPIRALLDSYIPCSYVHDLVETLVPNRRCLCHAMHHYCRGLAPSIHAPSSPPSPPFTAHVSVKNIQSSVTCFPPFSVGYLRATGAHSSLHRLPACPRRIFPSTVGASLDIHE